MSRRLPVELDPLYLAERGRVLEGSLPVAAFKRLGHWLHGDSGAIETVLRFERGEGGRQILRGSMQGRVELVCQRCLSSFLLPIEREFHLVLVESMAEADLLPEELEPLLIDPRRGVHTVDLLEDELILALPLVPRCGEGGHECEAAIELLVSEDQVEPLTGSGSRR